MLERSIKKSNQKTFAKAIGLANFRHVSPFLHFIFIRLFLPLPCSLGVLWQTEAMNKDIYRCRIIELFVTSLQLGSCEFCWMRQLLCWTWIFQQWFYQFPDLSFSWAEDRDFSSKRSGASTHHFIVPATVVCYFTLADYAHTVVILAKSLCGKILF